MDVGIEFVYGVPVVVAAVEFLKLGIPPLKSRAWLLPWVTLLLAVGFALLAIGGPVKDVVLKGVMVGLMTTGTYRTGEKGVVEPIRDAQGLPK